MILDAIGIDNLIDKIIICDDYPLSGDYLYKWQIWGEILECNARILQHLESQGTEEFSLAIRHARFLFGVVGRKNYYYGTINGLASQSKVMSLLFAKHQCLFVIDAFSEEGMTSLSFFLHQM